MSMDVTRQATKPMTMATAMVTYCGWIVLVCAIAGIGSGRSLLHASRAAISPASPNPWFVTVALSARACTSASSVSVVVNQTP
eukprot:7101198-Prymnesium_polylepis.1